MIEELKEKIFDYKEELRYLSYEEIEQMEEDSFIINDNRFNELSGLINERIKISDTFTHYIIERCRPKHANILRRFVEEYEKQVDLFKNGLLDREEIENLKMVTIAIDLLFGIDVSYYTKLNEMFHNGNIQMIYYYFVNNIDYGLSYSAICEVLNKKGYDMYDNDPRDSKTR
jgi:hypothetical protein